MPVFITLKALSNKLVTARNIYTEMVIISVMSTTKAVGKGRPKKFRLEWDNIYDITRVETLFRSYFCYYLQ